MDRASKIEDVLSGSFDYDKAVSLLADIAPKHAHLRKLRKGFNFRNKALIISILKNFNDSIVKAVPTHTPSHSVTKKHQAEDVAIDQYEISERELAVLKKLKNERNKLFSEATFAHHELTALPLNHKERALRAQLIVENFDKLKDVWAAIDYFALNGKLPLKYMMSENAVDEAFQISRRIHNIRTYISKAERKIQLVKKESTKSDIQEKINLWKIELNTLLSARI